MATTLRQVLNLFEHTANPLSLTEVARSLDLEQGVLEGMLQYWVHKGRLREVSGDAGICPMCSKSESCTIMPDMPRRYELVTGQPTNLPLENPRCLCCE
jgi:hypothetical protein